MVISQNIYDGSLIHNRFAYQFLKKGVSPTGDIVSFVAPMVVTTNLIDLEDSLNKDYIHSDEAINFCWEIPNLCPFGAVAFQRYFATNIANILHGFIQKQINVDGDDIMVIDKFVGVDNQVRSQGKASVSITYSKDNVAIGHLGINVNAGKKAPGFAYSTKLSEEQQVDFMKAVEDSFYNMTKDMFIATTKVIV